MRRLLVPPGRVSQGRARLEPADLHYLRDVLRLGPGAALEVFDGEGRAYPAQVAASGDELLLGEPRQAPPAAASIQLAFALARGERTDLVVQKATELGVTRLSPFEAARSVVRLAPDRAEERTRRWRRIAAEAARQCGRADVPGVDPPTTLDRLLAGAAPGARRILLWERGGEPLAEAVDRGAGSHQVVVGPEGGFAPEEVEAALGAGARLATLGPRILRFETAAIVVVALVQHLAGDLGGRDL